MVRRAWAGLLVVLALAGGRAAAQDDIKLGQDDRLRVLDLRNGKKPVNGPEQAANLKAIDDAARFCVLRITGEVNRGLKAGKPEPMTELVKDMASYALDLNPPEKKIVEGQKEYVQAFGKAALTHLRTVFGPREKPTSYEPLVRVNAARLLSVLARSGYEDTADLAVELIENPKESDAVRLYALQALKHLFAAINPDDRARSMIASPDRERKAVKTLIGFLTRKTAVTADTPAEEVEALRYVRREAVRALGQVRRPIFRGNQTVEAAPAVWLLRVACADPVIAPAPGVAERVEALIGYLQLAPDRQENYDYAVFFVARAAREIAAEFNQRQQLSIDPKKPPAGGGQAVNPRDYHPWRVSGARLEAAIRDWLAVWKTENPTAPPALEKLVTDLQSGMISDVFAPLQSMNPGNTANPGNVDAWLTQQAGNQVFVSQSLFKDDPTATVTLPQP